MQNLIEDQKMIEHEIHDEMKNSYIDYAMSVIVGRALPDVRDGLKPVHRRILYGMSGLGITPDKPFKKSARIVGEVMGKYHPHGDSSIYDAMVRLAQDFSTRYLLVDGHGNFGSVDGDGAAAMRYTEARMSPFSLEMIRDIDKDTVDFMPNFDEEEKEPVVLPARFPNLLVNGSNGIAVGMATSIPPHNLSEVIDATVKMIDDENCTIEDLVKIVKGPDFPTGAQILGKKGAREAYMTGQGKVMVRAVANIEETVGQNGSVVTDYQFDKNTHTDSHFLQESLSAMEKSEEEIILVTDGGYDGQDNIALAKEKNVKLITTALIGKEAPEALADFEFNEDGSRLLKCAAGHEPVSQSFTKSTRQCRVSFDRNHCSGCPYQDQCHPKIYKKVATFITSKNASNRAKSQRYMQSEEFRNLARLRNGVETIPANIRKNYHLDKLPRGKQRGKFFFGSKIAALNFRKLFGFRKGLGNYAQNPILA